MTTEYATMDTVLPLKDLHVQGTTVGPNGKVTFWFYNPQLNPVTRCRCGICRRPMAGRHCKHCYPNKKD